MPGSFYLLIINGAILTVCAVFIGAQRHFVLIGLLLFLPLLDHHFRQGPRLALCPPTILQLLTLCLIALLLLSRGTGLTGDRLSLILAIILLTALPEEWFFRAYFQQTLQTILTRQAGIGRLPLPVDNMAAAWIANIITSTLFAILHVPLQGVMGLSVFLPSLFFGWLYQQKNDIILVILVHALFNLFYIIILHPAMQGLV